MTGSDIEKDKNPKIFEFHNFVFNFCQTIDRHRGLESSYPKQWEICGFSELSSREKYNWYWKIPKIDRENVEKFEVFEFLSRFPYSFPL